MAVTVLFCLSATSAHAWNPLKKKEGVLLTVTQPYIELRTGPGKGYPVFHVMERGEKLRAFKRHTDWYKIESEAQLIGWVHRDELTDTLSEEGYAADFSRPGRLEYEDRRWELGLLGGDYSGAESLSPYIAYHLTPNISAELRYTQAFGEFSNIKQYSANIVHQPWPQWWISPFVTLGAGEIETAPNGGPKRRESALTAGGGISIYASRNFLLRLEYNAHTVLTSRTENEEVREWKAGFSVFF